MTALAQEQIAANESWNWKCFLRSRVVLKPNSKQIVGRKKKTDEGEPFSLQPNFTSLRLYMVMCLQWHKSRFNFWGNSFSHPEMDVSIMSILPGYLTK